VNSRDAGEKDRNHKPHHHQVSDHVPHTRQYGNMIYSSFITPLILKHAEFRKFEEIKSFLQKQNHRPVILRRAFRTATAHESQPDPGAGKYLQDPVLFVSILSIS